MVRKSNTQYPLKETPIAAQAFKTYYEMGDKRSLKAVAQKLGISKVSVERYSKIFKWRERIEELDRAQVEATHKALVRNTVESKLQTMEINQKLKDDFAKMVNEGKVRVRTIKDYISVDRHDLLVRGEPTERTESTNIELKGQVKNLLAIMGAKIAESGNEQIKALLAEFANASDE
jgi:hypothetical protein